MTIDEILKAIDDLSDEDKKKVHQTLSDRIDESVAAQEKDDGDEDKQDAKDHIDESLGEEAADAKKDEDEPEDNPEDKGEPDEPDEPDADDALDEHKEDDEEKGDALEARIARIEAMLMKIVGEDKEKSADVEEKAKEVYGLGGGTFAPEEKGAKNEKVDVRRTLRNIGF